MNLGLACILVVALGYLSNWLNWRFLNYRITHILYYVGALIHESSHALLCLLTGAPIYKYKVFVSQPYVEHGKSKLPLIGSALISLAPIAGGMLFLFLINAYFLGGYFSLTFVNIFSSALHLLAELRPWNWQSWVLVALFLNVGAMLGPSLQDIKNIWLIVIIMFFIPWPLLTTLFLLAATLIVAGIIIQIGLILLIGLVRAVKR